jgi:type VI secretion system secreted protein VgrG
MTASRALTQAHASLALSTPLGLDKLVLAEVSGTEEVCGLFAFTCLAHAVDDAPDWSAVLGKPACVTLVGADGAKRYLHGICTQVSQSGRTCRLVLRPWLWRLSLRAGSRIRQDKSVPDIVKDVFRAAGESDVSDKLGASYPPIAYCVQYRESDLDFVCRLMEEVGIGWYFTHQKDRHTLVLVDDAGGWGRAPGDGALPFLPLPTGADWLQDRRVTCLDSTVRLVSGTVTLRDYAFETPRNDLTADKAAGKPDFEVYDHPGGYATKGEGAGKAGLLLAALQGEAAEAEGESDFRGMAAGLVFSLSGHPQGERNGDWRLHGVSHRAGKGEYANDFICRKAASPFRPLRRTPRPRIPGSQTATVVGPKGEEIHTDKYGRVKLQFHWDREGTNDEKSSAFVRVAQPLAGNGWGHVALPRVGQEVVVTFLEGDPDRPLVTGTVYNGDNMPPYALPDNKTRTVWKSQSSPGGDGFNELRFEDKAGEEEVFLQAQKALALKVLADETHEVGGKRSLTVTGDETHTNKAAVTYTISGDFTLKVDGDITIQAGGKVTIKAGSTLAVEAGTDFTAKGGAGATVKAGTALSLSGATAELKGSATGTVDGGGALTVKGGIVKIN